MHVSVEENGKKFQTLVTTKIMFMRLYIYAFAENLNI